LARVRAYTFREESPAWWKQGRPLIASKTKIGGFYEQASRYYRSICGGNCRSGPSFGPETS
jgi:hypothetical protein